MIALEDVDTYIALIAVDDMAGLEEWLAANIVGPAAAAQLEHFLALFIARLIRDEAKAMGASVPDDAFVPLVYAGDPKHRPDQPPPVAQMLACALSNDNDMLAALVRASVLDETRAADDITSLTFAARGVLKSFIDRARAS